MRGIHKPQENLLFHKDFKTGTVFFQLLARSLKSWSFLLSVGSNHPPPSKGTYWVENYLKENTYSLATSVS